MESECHHYSLPLTLEVDAQLDWCVLSCGASPLIVEPKINRSHFTGQRAGFGARKARISMTATSSTNSQPTGKAASNAVVLIGRILFALIFLVSAPGNLSRQMLGFALSRGVPLANVAVPIAGGLSLLGGLSIAIGYRARIGAWLVVLFLVPVTLMMHRFWGISDPGASSVQFVMFMKNLPHAWWRAAYFSIWSGSAQS